MKIQDFIDRFKDIPEKKWCVGFYHTLDGRSCALGHLGSDTFGFSYKSKILIKLFDDHGFKVANVNDGLDNRFQQDTPKKRVLAALDYISKKG